VDVAVIVWWRHVVNASACRKRPVDLFFALRRKVVLIRAWRRICTRHGGSGEEIVGFFGYISYIEVEIGEGQLSGAHIYRAVLPSHVKVGVLDEQ